MTASDRVPIWLDCDPGHDDVFAILLAAHHPKLHLLGLSTVYGNTSVQKTSINAASILTALGKHEDIQVYVGAGQGISRPPMHAPTAIHGESGIDGTELLPKPLRIPNTVDDAVDAMAAAILARDPGTAYLVATGAFTNVALLIRRYPQIVSHLKGLSVMGGAFGGGFTDVNLGSIDGKERTGNYTPWAEFNIIADPEAAAELFNNKDLAAKTTVVPLDLSHQVLATPEVQSLLLHGSKHQTTGKATTQLRQMLVELIMYFAETYDKVYGITAGPPLHDPLAVAAILKDTPDEIPFYDFDPRESEEARKSERFSIAVETNGSYEEAVAGVAQTGKTTLTKLTANTPGITIPRGVDKERFWDVLEECIQRADALNEALLE